MQAVRRPQDRLERLRLAREAVGPAHPRRARHAADARDDALHAPRL